MYSILEAEPLDWGEGWDSFKLGRKGWPVVFAQVALNSHYKPSAPPLILDGIYGPESDRIGREVQAACHVKVDGVIGPATQEAFVKAKCVHAQKNTTPPGLPAGLCAMESSYFWPCVSPQNPNKSYDVGVAQDSILPSEWTVARLTRAANPDAATHVLAHEVAAFHDGYVALKLADRRAWEVAAMAHNWPWAADKLAHGDTASLNKPFAFTTAKGYDTALDYCNHYIAQACSQVTSWAVAT